MMLSSFSATLAFGQLPSSMKTNQTGITGNYTLQWSMDYGTDPRTCARFQGPQPIGDADNDGKNEINAGNVYVDTNGQPYMEWIFKYEPGT